LKIITTILDEHLDITFKKEDGEEWTLTSEYKQKTYSNKSTMFIFDNNEKLKLSNKSIETPPFKELQEARELWDGLLEKGMAMVVTDDG